ncbi:MAG: TIGR03617 family F420-dependent LLM class oxidoreductase [Chloroflexi bacterium]|nr:TIGR03617 family F420-dependent LLM class oxidoreductase [Chloroflexota bacterium]
MKIDALLLTHNLKDMPTIAQAAEAVGFDGLWTAETQSDPFLPLVLAAEHSQRMSLGTSIAVTFPRSPGTLAYLAWDLARYSNGRFILGLGAQVRAHNERRFGARWEKPVRKMRETIEAVRAIWNCWQHDTPLRYEGEFFRLKLMTPFFSSGPLQTPPPPIYISAVNKMMLRLAGSHCEGVHLHALHTVKYLREFALPHIEEGFRRGGRKRADFSMSTGLFVVPTDDPKAAEQEAFIRQQISFYMSTPAYKVVADLHGWNETAFRLSKLARRGDWDEMPKLVTDEMLAETAVTAPWADLPHLIHEKYGSLLDRVSYYLPFVPGKNDDGWRQTIAGFRQNA